ncbi:MAG: metal-dependent hydrolase [Candidatus Riflebacteria bacterium]|nr:metal-dependent hydrolase [Candidatus Riflebacteria bacterium]
MKITWLGHSAVKLEADKTILIDPFFAGPSQNLRAKQSTGVDFVAVTHAHGDHIGDAFAICKENNATFIGGAELANKAEKHGLKTLGMNVGGKIVVDGVVFNMVFAAHSANIGSPAGFVVEMNGSKVYHAGDTGLTLEMKLIGDLFKPDLSFLPIGDTYTMGVDAAAIAVEYLQTKRVVPIHYNTFPAINADPNQFKNKVGKNAEVIILEPGKVFELK